MKTAVIFTDGIKQIVFTPETKEEKYALSLITSNDDIELLVKSGSIGSKYNEPFTANIDMCKGGYLRLFSDEESRILILKPKEKKLV